MNVYKLTWGDGSCQYIQAFDGNEAMTIAGRGRAKYIFHVSYEDYLEILISKRNTITIKLQEMENQIDEIERLINRNNSRVNKNNSCEEKQVDEIVCPKCKKHTSCESSPKLDKLTDELTFKTKCGCTLTFKEKMDGIDMLEESNRD